MRVGRQSQPSDLINLELLNMTPEKLNELYKKESRRFWFAVIRDIVIILLAIMWSLGFVVFILDYIIK